MSSWSPAASLGHAHAYLGAAVTASVFGPPLPLALRLYVVGGSGDSGDMESLGFFRTVFPPEPPSWAPDAALPTPRFGHAVCAGYDHRIYAFGGRSNPAGALLKSVAAFAPPIPLPEGAWTSVAAMPTARERAAAAQGHDGMLYVAGGSDGPSLDLSAPLKTFQGYNIAADNWTKLPAMHTARDGAAAVTGPDGRIYVIGGFGTAGSLSSVEAYDPTTKSWKFMASLATPRDGLAAVLGPDGQIYAIGGENGPETLSRVEIYNFTSKTWSPGPSLSTARSYLAAATGTNGLIYAIGGNTAVLGPTASVEALSAV
jgi:N-acetylneuraminic acid mutarotase